MTDHREWDIMSKKNERSIFVLGKRMEKVTIEFYKRWMQKISGTEARVFVRGFRESGVYRCRLQAGEEAVTAWLEDKRRLYLLYRNMRDIAYEEPCFYMSIVEFSYGERGRIGFQIIRKKQQPDSPGGPQTA